MMAAWNARLAERLEASGAAPAVAPRASQESSWETAILAGARAVDPRGWLWRIRDSDVHVLRSLATLTFGPAEAVAIAQAIANCLPPRAPLMIVEDSAGHATTRAAEAVGVSEFLAAHAAQLALARMEGHALLGLLAGCGHSAAFFVNALQAPSLDALAGARVEAMAPDAIARVTRLPAAAVKSLIEDDAMMGQPARHLAALGGVSQVHGDVTRDSLLTRVDEARTVRASAQAQ